MIKDACYTADRSMSVKCCDAIFNGWEKPDPKLQVAAGDTAAIFLAVQCPPVTGALAGNDVSERFWIRTMI